MKVKYFIVLLIITSGCKKPYTPPAISAPARYLVVEGVINVGNDSTVFRLSRTVNIKAADTVVPEPNAIVTVESDASNSYPLSETSRGHYAAPSLHLDISHQYRLRIKTADKQQYLSDLVTPQITPPIDSIGFNLVSAGGDAMQVYVNTYDATNNTKYYRWDYSEAWEFHAAYVPDFITNGYKILPRSPEQTNTFCYNTDSTNIVSIASSAQLSKDIIYQYPITTVPSTSQKLQMKYTILVHEYALSGDAYAFWANLKKNTEQLGSIFDAQPSTAGGNIHNLTEPAVAAIGYVSASTVRSKRIYITHNELPSNWQAANVYNCGPDSVFKNQPRTGFNEIPVELIPLGSTLIPVDSLYGATGGYLASELICVDCTLTGTKTPPPFWK